MDGLRGLLSLQVAVFHLYASYADLRQAIDALSLLIFNSWIAVDIFFVMSGFVMTHVYKRSFAVAVSRKSYYNFMVARFARVYPLNALTVVVLVILVLPVSNVRVPILDQGGTYSWQAALASLILLQGPALDHRTWNYPAWSVSIEWCIYFLFPFLLRLGRSQIAAVFTIFLTTISLFAIYKTCGEHTNGMLGLLRGLLLFCNGIALYAIWHMPGLSSNALAFVVIAAALITLSFAGSQLAAVFLISPIVLVTLRNGAVSAFMNTAFLQFLGAVSFSLYMVHAPIQIIVIGKLSTLFDRAFAPTLSTHFLLATLGLLLSFVAAVLSLIYFERPLRVIIRKKLHAG